MELTSLFTSLWNLRWHGKHLHLLVQKYYSTHRWNSIYECPSLKTEAYPSHFTFGLPTVYNNKSVARLAESLFTLYC